MPSDPRQKMGESGQPDGCRKPDGGDATEGCVACGSNPPRNTHYCGNCGKPVCLVCGEKHFDDCEECE